MHAIPSIASTLFIYALHMFINIIQVIKLLLLLFCSAPIVLVKYKLYNTINWRPVTELIEYNVISYLFVAITHFSVFLVPAQFLEE